MPRSTTTRSPRDELPEKLRPYAALGVNLRWRADGREAFADCPWCGRNGDKFSVNTETGQWHCFVCQEGNERGGGNALTFLRKLWERSFEATNGDSDEFARERGLLYLDTLMHWGVVKSVLTSGWLVPGYSPDGKLCQLYRRVLVRHDASHVRHARDGDARRWELRPTPTLPHALHGVPLYDKGKGTVWLHESWGNALTHWETGRMTKRTDEGYAVTGNEGASLLADVNVLAVANCGAVGEPLRRFLPLFAGKRVVLAFDSDHPKQMCQKCKKSWSTIEHQQCPVCSVALAGPVVESAGFSAVKRAVKMMTAAKKPLAEIAWVKWGADGHDPDKPSGWDVRDFING